MNNSTKRNHANCNPSLWACVEQWFAYLNLEFDFTLDPYYAGPARDRPRFFTPAQDGLNKVWSNERVFVSPLSGLSLPKWLTKAHFESREHGALVVCLLQANFMAAWWQQSEFKASEVRLPKGQAKSVPADEAGAFPIAILIFRPLVKTIANQLPG